MCADLFLSRSPTLFLPGAQVHHMVQLGHCACLTLLAPLVHLPPKGFPKTPESVPAKSEFSTCVVAKGVFLGKCGQCCYLAKFFSKKKVVSFILTIFKISGSAVKVLRFPSLRAPIRRSRGVGCERVAFAAVLLSHLPHVSHNTVKHGVGQSALCASG